MVAWRLVTDTSTLCGNNAHVQVEGWVTAVCAVRRQMYSIHVAPIDTVPSTCCSRHYFHWNMYYGLGQK